MIYTHVLNRAPAAGRHEYHAAGDGGISCGVSLPNAGHGPEGGPQGGGNPSIGLARWELSVVIYGTMLSDIAV